MGIGNQPSGCPVGQEVLGIQSFYLKICLFSIFNVKLSKRFYKKCPRGETCPHNNACLRGEMDITTGFEPVIGSSNLSGGTLFVFYVYFIFLNNGNIYKGLTDNLKRRVSEHILGKVVSTKNKRPLKLIYYEAYLMKGDALKREKYLKTTHGRQDSKRQLSYLFKKLKGSPSD